MEYTEQKSGPVALRRESCGVTGVSARMMMKIGRVKMNTNIMIKTLLGVGLHLNCFKSVINVIYLLKL